MRADRRSGTDPGSRNGSECGQLAGAVGVTDSRGRSLGPDVLQGAPSPAVASERKVRFRRPRRGTSTAHSRVVQEWEALGKLQAQFWMLFSNFGVIINISNIGILPSTQHRPKILEPNQSMTRPRESVRW